MDRWDNVYVLAEYRVEQHTIDEIARDLTTVGYRRHMERFFPDPAEPGDTRALEAAFRVRAGGNTGGPISDRLDLIRRWLRIGPEHQPAEDRRPKLYVDRSCTELLREMGDYRYPETPASGVANENPLKKDDHGPEALGRFFRGYYGRAALAGGRSTGRLSRVRMRW